MKNKKTINPVIIIGAGVVVLSLALAVYFRAPLSQFLPGNKAGNNLQSATMIKASEADISLCKSLDERACNGSAPCMAQYNANNCAPNDTTCESDLKFVSCQASGLDDGELNKIQTECDKLSGSIIKENGKYQCICTYEENGETKINSCLDELITSFQTNEVQTQ